MSWARLDDGFWRNEKVLGCSDAALGLYVRALSYCAGQGTNGRISGHALALLGSRNGRKRVTAGQVAGLVLARLWLVDGDGWIVNDYLKYNPSVSEIDKKRMAKAMAGAKGAASRWGGRGNAPDPDPDPVPDPDPENMVRIARARKATEFYAAVTGREPENAFKVQMLDDIDHSHPTGCVRWAFEAAADKEAPWPYAKRLFDSCMIGGEGHGPRGGNTNGRTGTSGRAVRGVPGAGRGGKSGAGSTGDHDKYPASDGWTD